MALRSLAKLLAVTDGTDFRVIYNMYQIIKSCVKQDGALLDFSDLKLVTDRARTYHLFFFHLPE